MLIRPYTPTPNQSSTPLKKSIVVLHFTLGSFKGATSWLRNKQSQASAEFVIGREQGESVQLVPLDKKAWHAGRIHNPSQDFLKIAKKHNGKFVNPNNYCIGIEICAGYDIDRDGVVEPEEYKLSDWHLKEVPRLIRELDAFDGVEFQLDRRNIITHTDIASYKPGPGMQKYLAEAQKQLLAALFDENDVTLRNATIQQLLDELWRRVEALKK